MANLKNYIVCFRSYAIAWSAALWGCHLIAFFHRPRVRDGVSLNQTESINTRKQQQNQYVYVKLQN